MVMEGRPTRRGNTRAGIAGARQTAATVHGGTCRDDNGGGGSISNRRSSSHTQHRRPRAAAPVTGARTGGGDGGAVGRRDGRPRRPRPGGRQPMTVGKRQPRSATPGKGDRYRWRSRREGPWKGWRAGSGAPVGGMSARARAMGCARPCARAGALGGKAAGRRAERPRARAGEQRRRAAGRRGERRRRRQTAGGPWTRHQTSWRGEEVEMAGRPASTPARARRRQWSRRVPATGATRRRVATHGTGWGGRRKVHRAHGTAAATLGGGRPAAAAGACAPARRLERKSGCSGLRFF